MATKLTLRLDENMIKKAKSYAKKQKTSLSQLVSKYFQSLNNQPEGQQVSPRVEKISGLLSHKKPSSLQRERQKYYETLKQKHS